MGPNRLIILLDEYMNEMNRFRLTLEIQVQSQVVHWSGDRLGTAKATRPPKRKQPLDGAWPSRKWRFFITMNTFVFNHEQASGLTGHSVGLRFAGRTPAGIIALPRDLTNEQPARLSTTENLPDCDQNRGIYDRYQETAPVPVCHQSFHPEFGGERRLSSF
jgi:hypothetical protein